MRWLEKCLKSCKNQSIIVVDNGSVDDTCYYIETNFPDIILLKQNENKGFGQANNLAISYALEKGADHVFLLNQDAYLIDNVLDELTVFQNNHMEYGIISPIHVTNDRHKIDEKFANYMLKEVTGQFYSDFVLGNSIKPVYEVPFVNAASWLISKKCLETIGGFDPLFFHYGEDDNYCQRVIYHNFKIGVLPKTYVIHDRSDRKKSKITEFSHAYYEHKLRVFKRKQANILQSENINNTILKLRKTVLSLILQLKFSRGFSYCKELELLRQVKPKILKSREVNIKKGKHYLTQTPLD